MRELEKALNEKPKFERLVKSEMQKREPVEKLTKAEPKPKPTKKQNKPAPKKPNNKKENGFEDFVFEEPPPDDLIDEPKKVQFADNKKSDDEFWNYYDKHA